MLMPSMPFFILACAMLAIEVVEITGFVSVAVMGVWWWRWERAVG